VIHTAVSLYHNTRISTFSNQKTPNKACLTIFFEQGQTELSDV